MALKLSIVCTPKEGRTQDFDKLMTDLYDSLAARQPEGMWSVEIWRCDSPHDAVLLQAVWESLELHAAYRNKAPGRDLFEQLVDAADLLSVSSAPVEHARVLSWESPFTEG
jgi:hypothetical protein